MKLLTIATMAALTITATASDIADAKPRKRGSASMFTSSSGRSARRSRASSYALASGGATFSSCAAARAAGAAPVRAGQPGYSRRLDRDGDGIGCE